MTSFEKTSLWMNFLYFLNTIRQIFVINTSALVIISDNNYVISRFKRKGVKVLQVWHAAGAIKKFGNAIHREYPIANYDQVICNGAYWKKPYSEAFNVSEEHVSVTGMPRLDHLLDDAFIRSSRAPPKKMILASSLFQREAVCAASGMEGEKAAAVCADLPGQYL